MKKMFFLILILCILGCNQKSADTLPLVIEEKNEIPDNTLQTDKCLSCKDQFSKIFKEIDFQNTKKNFKIC